MLRPRLFEFGILGLFGVEFGGDVGAEILGVDFFDGEEKLHGVSEVLVVGDHGKADGVEVLLAIKTSGEVGFGVGGGVESVAQRA